MVSYRNLFSICTTMAVLFFMFQFFQLFKESGNAYDTNEYAAEPPLSGEKRWEAAGRADVPGVVFLGEDSGGIANVISQWCLYTKHGLTIAETPVQAAEMLEKTSAELLLIDGAALKLPEQEEALTALLEEKVTAVFVRLPEAKRVEESAGLKNILGIEKLRKPSVKTEGLQIFPGFLLGGEAVYKTTDDMDEKQKKLQDMELEMPWYQLGTGTKIFMTGLFDEDEVERELFPPVIWRNSYKGKLVFAVNGEYMQGLGGMGFLNAFCYECQEYSLYPVINAENVTVTGFPNFAEENAGRIMELYSRSPSTVQQDVMWPGIYALSEKNRRKLTFCFTTQYDYGDDCEPYGDRVVFFLQQMKEIGAEGGQNLEYQGNVTLADKLEADRAFWEENGGGYRFLAYYAGESLDEEEREAIDGGVLPDLRTVAAEYQPGEPLVSYYNSGITMQGITGHAEVYSYSQDLQRRSLETALGYYNLQMDLQPALWPGSKEDQWEHYFDVVSSNISTWWSGESGFDSTTLTESDGRIRNFLNLSYARDRQGDTVTVRVEGAGEAWFVLRTHRETIKGVQGGEYSLLEENAYLIHATDPVVRIQLEGETGQTGFYFS